MSLHSSLCANCSELDRKCSWVCVTKILNIIKSLETILQNLMEGEFGDKWYLRNRY